MAEGNILPSAISRQKLEKETAAEEVDVGGGEEKLVLQIRGHAAKLTVDEVESADEIIGGNAHEGADNFHLGFASTTTDDLCVEAIHECAVRSVGEVKVRYDRFSVHTEGKEQIRSSPPCPVLALEAMPEYSAVLGALHNQAKESGILELGIFATDERGVHVCRHGLHLGIEGIVDDMAFEVEESFLRDRLLCQSLGAKVDGRQEMMGCTLHRLIRQGFRFSERAEIEDADEVEFVMETF